MSEERARARFAPSTTGPAHPGTLLAALLCWLDARSQGAHLQLRLEDLDPERSQARWIDGMSADLAWLGIEFDSVVRQSDQSAAHGAALDRLAQEGLLYPCACSRADLRNAGQPSADGGWCYPGTCRGRTLPAEGWRTVDEPLRMRMPAGRLELGDESGLDLSQDVDAAFGDPVVRRRDGAAAYHLASVVDDGSAGVTRIVRGRDLATSTATQVRIQEALGLVTPSYRHHLVLLEERGQKLAKLHGSVSLEALRPHMNAQEVVGFLASASGLRPTAAPLLAQDLLDDFDWSRVAQADPLIRWDGQVLSVSPVEE